MSSSEKYVLSAPIRLVDEKTPQTGEDLEVVVGLAASAAKAVAKTGRWTPEVIAQFERKLKAASEESKKGPFSFRVHWNGGGVSAFVFLADGASTHDLQTELREGLGDLPAMARASGDRSPALRFDVSGLGGKEQAKALSSLALLFETAAWKNPTYGKKREKEAKKPSNRELKVSVVSKVPGKEVREIFEEAAHLGEANNWVRTLAMLPPNELGPLQYRKWLESYAKQKGLKYEFISRKDLEKEKAGAFLAVLRADPETAGGIAKLSYRPSGAKKKLVLVGKGLCYDTGGYNIKGGEGMFGMHNDMTGSAVAAALCGLHADLESKIEVVCYLALAENLISPTAYKPNEVVVASNGKSIEVIDTDAEGRMVLCDTLAIASREKPDLMIDFATLTGAAVRALDVRRAAIFSNDRKLLEAGFDAGERSGERTWGFPIGEDYMKELESKVADLRQCASSNAADHIYAASFLAQFVAEGVRWIHMDLTPNEVKGGLGLIATETTGFGVFWARELVRRELG
jgi:leucyl aminopeptidase